ncbi:SHOCT domain-containing protein [Actinomadura sp. 9N407]|uniref:SHOCT domain-containing protein n=1 Tax=Actinomadura sp. 9N407 TaxID=3375154 RepID=UPI00379BA587
MTMLTTLMTHPGPWNEGGGGPADAPAWWPVFPITFGLFWLAVAAGVFYLVRRRMNHTATVTAAASDPFTQARTVVAERFARGEIDEDEYHARLSALRFE